MKPLGTEIGRLPVDEGTDGPAPKVTEPDLHRWRQRSSEV